MSSEHLTSDRGQHRYVRMQSEAAMTSSHSSRQQGPDPDWIFEELPKATIVSVSRPDASDITPMLLSYTIEFRYKQFKWRLMKKASQVFYLHFALKKRVIIEELHEKQEQVKEWLQNLGIGDHTTVAQDDDEADDDVVPVHHEESAKNRLHIEDYLWKESYIHREEVEFLLKVRWLMAQKRLITKVYRQKWETDSGVVNFAEKCGSVEKSGISSAEWPPSIMSSFPCRNPITVWQPASRNGEMSEANCLSSAVTYGGLGNWNVILF